VQELPDLSDVTQSEDSANQAVSMFLQQSPEGLKQMLHSMPADLDIPSHAKALKALGKQDPQLLKDAVKKTQDMISQNPAGIANLMGKMDLNSVMEMVKEVFSAS
jgi:hypothetical protein